MLKMLDRVPRILLGALEDTKTELRRAVDLNIISESDADETDQLIKSIEKFLQEKDIDV